MNSRLIVVFAAACLCPLAARAERLSPPEGTERPSPMLQRLVQGMGPGNVFGGMDARRPLVGVRFVSGGDSNRAATRLARWKAAVDFVQISAEPAEVMLCERAGVPWMGEMPGTPDLGRPGDPQTLASQLVDTFRDFPNLAGWTLPPTAPLSPESDKLGLTDPTHKEFVAWLQAQYADERPGIDTNADGFTLNRECSLELATWDDLKADIITANPLLMQTVRDWRETLPGGWVQRMCQAFRQADPTHAVAGALPSPDALDEYGVNLNSYDTGDAVGAELRCGRSWQQSREGTLSEGFDLRLVGDTIKITLPTKPASAFADWDVTLPPDAHLKFGCKPGDTGDGVQLAVKVTSDLRPKVLYDQRIEAQPASSDPVKVDVDLSEFSGKKVKLRIEAGPGPRRDTAGDRIEWMDPVLESGEHQASLVELVNWWQARVGYRSALPEAIVRDVVTGATTSAFDPAGCETMLSVITNRAATAGKRVLLNGVHPTGDTGACTPEALGAFWTRLLAFKPVGAVLESAGTGGDADVEPMVAEIARWRAFLQATRPYDRVARKRQIALFIPSSDAKALNTARGLEKYGVDVFTVNSLELAKPYKNVIIWLSSLDREAEAKAADLLQSETKGRRTLVVVDGPVRGPLGKKRSQDAGQALRDLLPVYPDSGKTATSTFEFSPGASLEIASPENVSWKGGKGFEPVKNARGQSVAARSASTFVLCGRPSGRASDTDLFVEWWFGISPYSILDSGFARVAHGDAKANSEGLWSCEGQGQLQVGDEMFAYDMAARKPVSGFVKGPCSLYVFPSSGARLVDPGVCYPVETTIEARDVVIRLDCPASLSDVGGYRIVFWTMDSVSPSIGELGVWTVKNLGGGFWEGTCEKPGIHTIRRPGAPKPIKAKVWAPMDH